MGMSVPLWVTIMLGVLAVIGTVGGAWGGQILAARRDDRRWEREQQREDLRWSREREREQRKELAERAHDNVKELRQQRIELYARYLAAYRKWLIQLHINWLFVRVNQKSDDVMELVERDKISKAEADVTEALAMIAFIASDHVVAVTTEAHQKALPLQRALTEKGGKVENVLSAQSPYEDRDGTAAAFIAAFRRDLGTSGATIVDLEATD
ncbi:hypothetical protein [Lentzea aerocolonigenes]|uniref:hypothetical protein n=1 Tax=Lentzea aerocolonigenes TaxID=68170 RepID=UPI0007516C7C|nr:hypothetical protein [Lentzea aerocolonigenes]MCP2248177.1 hypothetical protein [Lentzea aerocolonigenes]